MTDRKPYSPPKATPQGRMPKTPQVAFLGNSLPRDVVEELRLRWYRLQETADACSDGLGDIRTQQEATAAKVLYHLARNVQRPTFGYAGPILHARLRDLPQLVAEALIERAGDILDNLPQALEVKGIELLGKLSTLKKRLSIWE